VTGVQRNLAGVPPDELAAQLAEAQSQLAVAEGALLTERAARARAEAQQARLQEQVQRLRHGRPARQPLQLDDPVAPTRLQARTPLGIPASTGVRHTAEVIVCD
jgi:hypothetical protein